MFIGGIVMDTQRIHEYALKTSLAMMNPYHSVKRVFPTSIKNIQANSGYYIGVKDLSLDLTSFLEFLENSGFYKHTIDKASHNGRGIDINLKNPITGQQMTGSSSGTAVNVFLGLNDIGIGTDGGGSVLAPAAALNLIGFIHPALGTPFLNLSQSKKTSTDGIEFSPSLGFIGRELNLIKELVTISLNVIPTKRYEENFAVAIDHAIEEALVQNLSSTSKIKSERICFDDKYTLNREQLIKKLDQLLTKFDIIVSKEGPIDVYGIGDTVFGHFDKQTQVLQVKANKGFVRVVNMCQTVGLIVPSHELATGYLLIGKPTNAILEKMLALAGQLKYEDDVLISKYFREHEPYFADGINV